MIQYPTFESLRARQRNLLTEEKQRIVTAAAKRSPAGSTFLSHSSKDTEILPAVIKLLEDHGGSVYIDKKDPDLPPTTSRETATVLRGRIVASRKFILLASRNSKDSRWMPWELGISDGVKRSSNTAVLGVAEHATDTKWMEQEYLGIYDRIVFGDHKNYQQRVWMVYNQENHTATGLSDWLQRDS